MSIRRVAPLLAFALVATSLTGCDAGENTVIGTTDVSAAFVNQLVSVSPSRIQSIINPGAVCPQPLFFAPVNLVVTAGGGSDLFLSHMQVQFVDRTGFGSPPFTISRAALINRFGSTRVLATGTRTFPVEIPFGCAGVPPGTMTIVVFATDDRQQEHQTSVAVGVN